VLEALSLLGIQAEIGGYPGAEGALMSPSADSQGGSLAYVLCSAWSGGRQEIDRIDDRHGDDVFLGTKVEG